jgi:hypothetical protein
VSGWLFAQADPIADQPAPKPGDRVRVGRRKGTIVDAWHTQGGLSFGGRWHVRVELDNGKRVSCPLDQTDFPETRAKK